MDLCAFVARLIFRHRVCNSVGVEQPAHSKLGARIMRTLAFALVLLTLVPFVQAQEPNIAALAELHLREAAAYAIFLDEGQQQPLELQKEPVFKWQNLLRETGQLGAVYVWTREGRPELLGTIFSQHEDKQRVVVHEFHTLSERVLSVRPPKDVLREWKPKGSFPIKPLADAPAVSENASQRLLQLRSLAREFSAVTRSGNERTEMRLAPRPLVRYQPTRSDVLNGALFAFLSSAAGTDPEVVLMIEARRADAHAKDWTWHAGIARFTDRDLVVTRNNAELFSSVADDRLKAKVEDNYRWTHNRDDTYYVFRAKVVPEIPAAKTSPETDQP